jgi:hypothetical protein
MNEQDDILVADPEKAHRYSDENYQNLLAHNSAFRQLRNLLKSGKSCTLVDYVNYGKGIATLLHLLYRDVRENVAGLKIILLSLGPNGESEGRFEEMKMLFGRVTEPAGRSAPQVTIINSHNDVIHHFTNSVFGAFHNIQPISGQNSQLTYTMKTDLNILLVML